MNEKQTRSNREFIEDLTERLSESYADNIAVNHNEQHYLPRESEILENLDRIMELIFPGFSGRTVHSEETLKFAVGEMLAQTFVSIRDLIYRANRFLCRKEFSECTCMRKAEDAAKVLLESIPGIRQSMKLDIQAAFDGDPAARSLDEVVLSYPCIKTITIQRIAHALYLQDVPMIPRMMGEYAHRITGIDIHPGAKLGKGIFIDHGTGVVIGETAEIGDGVKIYQGVTLGALSFPKDACGIIIKGAKRHPTIEDNVTIYAGASILGAVTIGEGSVIGGNVWLTEDTPPGSKITIATPQLTKSFRKPKV